MYILHFESYFQYYLNQFSSMGSKIIIKSKNISLFYLGNLKIQTWLVAFEHFGLKQNYTFLLKLSISYKNASGAQYHGSIYILHSTSLKLKVLRHKVAFSPK